MLNLTLAFIPCAAFITMVGVKKQKPLYAAGDILLAAYLVFVLYYITDISSLRGVITDPTFGPVIYVPFSSEGISTYVLNVMLFVPLGVLLPVLFAEMRKWYNTALCGFLFSATIECFQMFNYRITDIDDLATNTIGTIIGFLLFEFLLKSFHKDPPKTLYAEPVTIIILATIGTFLFKDMF